jgi:hypothetical protein
VLEADTVPLHSVYNVATLITEEARRIYVLSALNIKIHRPVFTRVIAQIAKDMIGSESSDEADSAEVAVQVMPADSETVEEAVLAGESLADSAVVSSESALSLISA